MFNILHTDFMTLNYANDSIYDVRLLIDRISENMSDRYLNIIFSDINDIIFSNDNIYKYAYVYILWRIIINLETQYIYAQTSNMNLVQKSNALFYFFMTEFWSNTGPSSVHYIINNFNILIKIKKAFKSIVLLSEIYNIDFNILFYIANLIVTKFNEPKSIICILQNKGFNLSEIKPICDNIYLLCSIIYDILY